MHSADSEMLVSNEARDPLHRDREVETKRAFNKILRSASVSEQSSAKMRVKLQRAGFSDDIIENALDKAMSLSIIDDARYADCLIRLTLLQKKGMGPALKEIESLGIDVYELDSYLSYLEEGEDVDIRRAIEFLESHPPKSKNKRDGAFRKLVSKGYDIDVCSAAAKSYAEKIVGLDRV